MTRELSLRIREWAKNQGLPVSVRGRVAGQLIDAFWAANPDVHATAPTIDLVRATSRTPGRVGPDDYEWQAESPLGPIYTITFVRGLNAQPGTLHPSLNPR
ncbi:Lsr2 family DNA-binding protein [Microtetraspora glauca]|uniref:Lsr2 DNA-binding domain-containing protein n=1 Tax=Microtetraspora glauca TaxID=1996 RepID=A0ABV3GT14_MICGL